MNSAEWGWDVQGGKLVPHPNPIQLNSCITFAHPLHDLYVSSPAVKFDSRSCGRQSLGLYKALCSGHFFDSTLCRNDSNESDYVPLNSDTINLQP